MKVACILLLVLLEVWVTSGQRQRQRAAHLSGTRRPNHRWGRLEKTTEECSQPRETGRCRGYLLNWYYDPADSTCKSFVYGGCGGNDNRFWSRSQCERACVPAQVAPRSGQTVCSMPAAIGRCRATMPRYFYDQSRGACSTFFYGGCGGNGNNFQTLGDCESACMSRGDSQVDVWDF